MKNALLLTVGLVVLVGLVLLLFPPGPRTPSTKADLPWAVERLPDGHTQVLGLVPGVSTLADVRRRFGDELAVAIIAAPGEPGSLEGYHEALTLGPLTVKMIVTVDLPPATIDEMRQRALKSQYMESATRRFELNPEDKARAEAAPIAVLSLIPTVQLDEATLLQRFGPPAERIRTAETTEHFLYPSLGLDILLDQKGKELLQYVAPGQFSRLRQPLVPASPRQP